jgi:small subunit ribosomal protein S5
MNTEDTKQNTSTPAQPAPVAGTENQAPAAPRQGMDVRSRGRGGDRPGGRRGPSREPRAKPEFDQKSLGIRRVTRVAAGGRRFSFSVAMVAGNRKGWVGVGTGKSGDTAGAMDKAFRSAKKNMIKLALTKDFSIPHDVTAKYCSAVVSIRPNKGKGLVAGSSIRSILELAGVKNVTAKIISGSKNPLNNAQVAIKALSAFAQK